MKDAGVLGWDWPILPKFFETKRTAPGAVKVVILWVRVTYGLERIKQESAGNFSITRWRVPCLHEIMDRRELFFPYSNLSGHYSLSYPQQQDVWGTEPCRQVIRSAPATPENYSASQSRTCECPCTSNASCAPDSPFDGGNSGKNHMKRGVRKKSRFKVFCFAAWLIRGNVYLPAEKLPACTWLTFSSLTWLKCDPKVVNLISFSA